LFPTLPLEGLPPNFNVFAARGKKERADAGAYFAELDNERSYTNVAALTSDSTLRVAVAGM